MTSGEDYLDNLLAAAMQKEETMGVTMPEKASEEVLTDETTVAASVEETTVAAQVEETPITETPITEEQEADADANIEQEADERQRERVERQVHAELRIGDVERHGVAPQQVGAPLRSCGQSRDEAEPDRDRDRQATTVGLDGDAVALEHLTADH